MLERREALVHLLLGCLRLVTSECSTCRVAIALIERNGGREQCRSGGIDLHAIPPSSASETIGGKSHVIEARRRRDDTRLEYLRHHITDQAMIGVTVPSRR